LITSPAALADAVDLGLVNDPEPTGTFVDAPIVPLGTKLDLGGTARAEATTVYARGYTVAAFQFDGMYGIQPAGAFMPTRQVSFVREAPMATYSPKPIFQATIPTEAPTTDANYSPLSVVINVDVLPNTLDMIKQDSDLFTRGSAGEIIAIKTNNVARFDVTSSMVLWQLQFQDGKQ
jgi:hypothetical protein